ncbi:MAG: biotin--[acetyl-CoA-carboxylase] ligase [Vitreoscilla sp.]|nr:biotin--[acetyl-CoA-carboxylase] ligase [Polaromonas sp.]
MSLPADPIRWPLEAIWQAVEPQLPGFTCEVLPVVDSSNTELMRRFKAGQLEPTLLVAEQQSAGRGRLGRQWHSQRTGSLTFSLGLPLAPADWSGLSLAVGVSLAVSLDAANAPQQRIGLKWPNDLWLVQNKTERKLGGILVETATFEGQRYVVIGVGMNIRPAELAAQGDSAIAPGCLQDLQPGADVASTLLRVLPPLVQTVQAFAQFGFAPFQARFAQRDVLSSRDVLLSDGTQGQAHGVTESGALLVHTSAGMNEITSSEVSVRPC